jgi:hypothetical protein
MNKILYIIIASFFFTFSGFNYVNAFSLGQIISNTTGTMGLGTKFHLPQGEWTVAGLKSLNGGVRPVEVILIQSEGKSIKAILNIRYARDEGPTQGWDAVGGWKPAEHYDNNNCDDYDEQRSNFHQVNIDKKKQSLIIEGSCLAIFARNDIQNLNDVATDTSIIDAFDIANNYIQRKNLIIPEALVIVGSTYFTQKNQVHTYYMSNPAYSNIISNTRVPFKESEWNSYKINKYDDKKAYMANAISVGRNVKNTTAKNFKIYNKTIDLRPYDKIVLYNSSTSSSLPTKKNNAVAKLKKLKKMFDEGLISQKQYEQKSEDILDEL